MDEKYYHTKASVEEYIKLAKDVNGSNLITKLRQFLPENSDVLEIGSGPGSDWNILNEYYNITGSDNSKEFLETFGVKRAILLYLIALDSKTSANSASVYLGLSPRSVQTYFNDLKETVQIKVVIGKLN